MASITELPPFQRILTTNDASGKAVFTEILEPTVTMIQPLPNIALGVAYSTSQAPADINDDKDIEACKAYLSDPSSMIIQSGSVCRLSDIAPKTRGPMHRTVSIDYGVVLSGQVELVLDSGETRLMKAGDIVVQRGTMHAWRNPSDTEPVRMFFVMLGAKDIVVDGKNLGEEFVFPEGVPPPT